MKVTPAELRALDAYRRAGTVKGAAARLGKSPLTIEQQFKSARERNNVTTTVELLNAVFIEPYMPK